MDFEFIVVLLCVCCVSGVSIHDRSVNTADLPTDLTTKDLKMREVHPDKPDQYFCTGYRVERDNQYIVKFEALADAGTAHHILVFGCKRPASWAKTWACGRTCQGEEQIMFAWAKNAPPLQMPKDVGRHIGSTAGINYIVLQIHYARVFTADDPPDKSGIRIYLTQERQKYVAGIYLLLAYDLLIPANTSKIHADVSCRFDWDTSIFPFGYRTHAHSLGRVISGYRVRNDSYEQIGKGNPQWPQAFYPVGKRVEVKPGDVLAAQCTYSSIGRNRDTRIGGTHNDEMCNFYIMYYMDAGMENSKGSETCPGNNVPFVPANFPADSDTPLPPNPVLEEDAKGHSHKVHMQGDHEKEHMQEGGENPQVLQPQNVPSVQVEEPNPKMNLKFVSSVPAKQSVVFGQVGGVATNEEGDVYVFHRGSIIWNSLSFDLDNIYQLQNLPVDTDPIVIIGQDDKVKRSFGKGMFYLPHGLTVDKEGNIWLTDVGLHQVFKIPPGSDTPSLTLGKRFVPGNDEKHFCKPTDVAVMSTGEFFVSDGYCNARVMKFDKNGNFLKQWGMTNGAKAADDYPYPGAFNVPHSITLAEDRGLVCVADRENGRIQCFDLEGDFIRQMHPPSFGAYLYAVEYCPLHGGVLFAVNGPDYSRMDVAVQGFTLEIDTGKLRAQWNIPIKGLSHPHDVTVHSPSHTVYVGELNPAKVWKFKMAEFGAKESKNVEEVEKENFAPALIIGVLLVVPVVLLVIITIVVRLYQTVPLSKKSHLGECSKRRSKKKIKFNLGNILNSHKGFDRLSTEDDDHDIDVALDDSDQEEFSAPVKNSKA